MTTRRDTTDSDIVRIYAIAGNNTNGGERPDNNEDLRVYYRANGSNSTWQFLLELSMVVLTLEQVTKIIQTLVIGLLLM